MCLSMGEGVHGCVGEGGGAGVLFVSEINMRCLTEMR